MKTLGIDLATKPEKTGVCSLLWGDEISIELLETGADDARLVELINDSDKVGLDAPLGWPLPFLEAMAGQLKDPSAWKTSTDSEKERRDLAMRLTDKYVQQITGKRPLSSSTDLIALVAFRAMRILSLLGETQAKDGSNKIAEIYPGASLLLWKIGEGTSYKGNDKRGERERIFAGIRNELPTLRVGKEERELLVENDDLLDAFLSSLLARTVALGLSRAAKKEERSLALQEGWIHLPNVALKKIALSLKR